MVVYFGLCISVVCVADGRDARKGHEMHFESDRITRLILAASKKAHRETGASPDSRIVKIVEWPVTCTVGPGLEGAIACESKVGYVNGAQGGLSYRGYDIFDLCAHSNYEEVCFLLLIGNLPSKAELRGFSDKLRDYLHIPDVLRQLAGFPIERMNPMAALRLGTNLMRHEQTDLDFLRGKADEAKIGTDEDSIPMETLPRGEEHAIYEFRRRQPIRDRNLAACCRLISGVASMAAAIARMREGHLPLAPDPELSYAGNVLYMTSGERPSAEETRIMDVALILHADHGMNASTFAALVVASTLADVYSSVSAGIGALTGPLHGGANEQVMHMLRGIGSVANVKPWVKATLAEKKRVMGFGHRVYKVYDPRARVLAPLAALSGRGKVANKGLFQIAAALETEIASRLGKKGIFPNVDFYSGLVYTGLGISERMFTPMFAVSRVAGWTARILEYLKNNRIFRPRVMYSGAVDRHYVPIAARRPARRKKR